MYFLCHVPSDASYPNKKAFLPRRVAQPVLGGAFTAAFAVCAHCTLRVRLHLRQLWAFQGLVIRVLWGCQCLKVTSKLVRYFRVAWGLSQSNHLIMFWFATALPLFPTQIFGAVVLNGDRSKLHCQDFHTSDIFSSLCITSKTFFFHIICSCCAHLDVGGDI